MADRNPTKFGLVPFQPSDRSVTHLFTATLMVTAAVALSFADVNTIHWRLPSLSLTLPSVPLTSLCLPATALIRRVSPWFPLLGRLLARLAVLAVLCRYFLALRPAGRPAPSNVFALVICDACCTFDLRTHLYVQTAAYVPAVTSNVDRVQPQLSCVCSTP